ncbi:hypothetical protein UY3_02565 [Chelonia mydas]|uniref:Uncharacterized protein n=1 Tax=Chelonia mydas TaxID=8469 RepID=M7C6L9_CHEMY|nr:hypothetical protein UY3_02565 [Chelonia mydas]
MCRAAATRERGDFPQLQGCGCRGQTALLPSPSSVSLPAPDRVLLRRGREGTSITLEREKEEQLTRVTEVQRLQAQQADAALEEFKRQVELNSEKVYAEMKQQMEKVESDLSRSKSLREKQSKEFSWQFEELKQRYEQQIVELKLEHEQEKTHLFQQHNTEKDCLVRDHEREIEKLEKQLRAAMTEHENKTQECRKRDAQVMINNI